MSLAIMKTFHLHYVGLCWLSLFTTLGLPMSAQSFNLPYNPDENGDMLIGVVDLQALLANYGQEFSGAVLSEDGESAITYMGEMAYPVCALSCENLPGMWHMATMTELAMVWEDVYTTNESIKTWVGNNQKTGFYPQNPFPFFNSNANVSPTVHYFQLESRPALQYRCYCAARQLPRLEFYKCVGNGSNAVEQCVTCTNTKLAEGWQLLPPGGGSTVQDLWRWAE